VSAGTPPGLTRGNLTPAEREARWKVGVLIAIEAADVKEASAVLGQVLAKLEPGLPLRGQPVIHPRHRLIRDNIWIADIRPDLTHLPVIDPDNAKTRCSFVHNHFPMGVTWTVPVNGESEARYEWPQQIWQREPGRDDLLLHPALRAVTIFCREELASPEVRNDK
jgi:hypothetical protein